MNQMIDPEVLITAASSVAAAPASTHKDSTHLLQTASLLMSGGAIAGRLAHQAASTLNSDPTSSGTSGLGGIGDDPNPYDPDSDPTNNQDDGSRLPWPSSDPSSLPYSDSSGFPGSDIETMILRYLFDLSYFPGSTGVMDGFWEMMSNLAQSGKLEQLEKMGYLPPGSTALILEQIAELKVLMYVRAYQRDHQGALPPTNDPGFQQLIQQLEAQMPGSGIAQDVRNVIAQLGSNLNWTHAYDSVSVSQAWGNFLEGNPCNKAYVVSIGAMKSEMMKFKMDQFGNDLDGMLIFFTMMMESTYDDQISGTGFTTDWVNKLGQEIKEILSEMNTPTSTNPPVVIYINGQPHTVTPAYNNYSGADILKRLQDLQNEVDGSYLGKNLKSLIDSQINQIFSLPTGDSAHPTLGDLLTAIKDKKIDPKQGDKELDEAFSNLMNNKSPDGRTDTASTIQNAGNSIQTSITDLSPPLSAQLSQETNLSKTQTSTAQSITKNIMDGEAQAVRNIAS